MNHVYAVQICSELAIRISVCGFDFSVWKDICGYNGNLVLCKRGSVEKGDFETIAFGYIDSAVKAS